MEINSFNLPDEKKYFLYVIKVKSFNMNLLNEMWFNIYNMFNKEEKILSKSNLKLLTK